MPIEYTRHSPSRLNKFAAAPAMFVLEELMGMRQVVGVPAHRGTAVEAGVAYGLLHPGADPKDCFKQAYKSYDGLTVLSADERREKYRDAIPAMVTQALDELTPYGVPSATQGAVTWQPEGLKYPIYGLFDFYWEEHGIIVDLKTTERMPSEIKIPHARQVAFYADGNYEGRLAYVTPKKSAVYKLENIAKHRAALLSLAQRVENFLLLGKEPEDFIEFTAPDLEHYYWNTPEARELAFRYWRV